MRLPHRRRALAAPTPLYPSGAPAGNAAGRRNRVTTARVWPLLAPMRVLGIETSCDETAAAVVEDGRVRASRVRSQVRDHAPFGGVVPELASRRHVEALPGLLAEALREAGLAWSDLDLIAVTAGPGLAGALLVGVGAAQALHAATGLPLAAVHHLQGHLHSVFLGPDAPDPMRVYPMLVLLVSGGHTGLVRVAAPGRQAWIGRTLDDAAGEALDKGATLLGLGYPGGPAIERAARGGDPARHAFPRGRIAGSEAPTGGLDPELCLSFSGLKTALRYYLRDHPEARGGTALRDTAAAYQEAVIDALCARVGAALGRERYAALAGVGGVARNGRLRSRLGEIAATAGIPLLLAAPDWCTDNAAMIAAAAGAGLGRPVPDPAALDVRPNWPL